MLLGDNTLPSCTPTATPCASSSVEQISPNSDIHNINSLNSPIFDTELVSVNEAADYRSAAEQGDAVAQNNLVRCYATGKGVGQDWEEAAKWYRMAADQGVAEAQTSLAFCYFHGHGVAQDRDKAVNWYRKPPTREEQRPSFILETATFMATVW
jgi:hypothetical protein